VWRRGLALASAHPASGAGTLWGRARIADLTGSLHRGADPESVKQAVIATALRHEIVSRYTSLVAAERRIARPVDEPVFPRDVPRNLPDGWEYEKIFGGPARTREARRAMAPPRQHAASIALPAGGTDARLHFVLGMLCLGLAGAFALGRRRE
jgi:Ca-activated chloride channel family protein